MEFHGIPWNCSCQRNWRNPLHWRHYEHDSVSNHQPHGCLLSRLFRRRSQKTSKLRVTGLRVGNSPGPVNSPHKGPVTRKMFPSDDVIMPSSIEFHGIQFKIGALQVPWNSMQLLVSATLVHSKFHGISWNCSCHRNWRTPSFIEFYGIPWNCSCQRNWRIPSSMEFHGIPWNCSCQQNWCIPSSMEFHGTARVIEIGLRLQYNSSLRIGTLQVPWNSMEFHGTARVSEIGALQVPWNSVIFCYLMKPVVSSILWVLNLDRIPWNLSIQILMTIISTFAGWTNVRKLISTLYLFVSLFHQLMFYYQYIGIIPHAFPALLITYQNVIQNLFSMPIETYYDQKFPWDFLQGSMELFEQHLWFHGT